MNTKNSKVSSKKNWAILIVLLFIAFGFAWESKGEEEKLLKVGNERFLFPAGFKVVKSDETEDIMFRINPMTLDQSASNLDLKDMVVVRIAKSDKYLGGSFRTEGEVISKEGKCVIQEDISLKVCEYSDVSLPEVPRTVKLYYKGSKPFLISRCIISGVPLPLCTDWGYFLPDLPNLKISYSYPTKYHYQILEIDKAVKSMLNQFKQNAQGK